MICSTFSCGFDTMTIYYGFSLCESCYEAACEIVDRVRGNVHLLEQTLRVYAAVTGELDEMDFGEGIDWCIERAREKAQIGGRNAAGL
jgi:hypothetical protein